MTKICIDLLPEMNKNLNALEKSGHSNTNSDIVKSALYEMFRKHSSVI
jgi:hypothetical protein